MRVVGYVREAPSLDEGETAFAQGERLRRWASESGHRLVATCQDGRDPLRPLSRDGFRAVLDIARSGGADAVVVADLSVLSPDKVTQEIMLDHLRALGLTVVSTRDEDHAELADDSEDHTRLVVRDVISKMAHFRDEFIEIGSRDEAGDTIPAEPDADVIVRLMPPDGQRDPSAAHTARPMA